MNLSRELSNILTGVLRVESSILQKLLFVRNMEQVEEVYTNQGEKSKIENPEFEFRPPSPELPPPPRPARPHLTMDHNSIIKPGSSVLAGRDPVSKLFHKRPSFQGEAGCTSTLQRDPERNSNAREDRDSTNGIDSTLGKSSVRGSVRYTKPLDVTVDSIHSGYIEDIILSKKKKTKLVNRYVMILFIITNLSLVGLSILGSLLIINHVNPCVCPPSETPMPGHLSLPHAGFAPGYSVSPDQDQRLTQDQPNNGRDIQGRDTTGPNVETGPHDADYSIHIVVENNKTNPGSMDDVDFWAY